MYEQLVEGSVAVTQDQRTCSICQVESLAVKEFLDGDKKKTPDATVSKPLDIPNINRQRHASDGNVTKAAGRSRLYISEYTQNY